MDTGLTTIAEADIAKHQAMAQSMITRVIVLEDSSGQSATALAGTGRRFVSTVSTGSVRKSREVESLQAKNARAPLEGEEAAHFKKLLSAAAYISAFSFASYLLQLIDGEGE